MNIKTRQRGRRPLPTEFKRVKTSLSLLPEIWDQFKVFCDERGTSASREIETFMKRKVKS